MHGVTTAIVAFIFAGVIWPHMVKHRVQFYAALITVVFIILLDGVGQGFADEKGGRRAIYAINALLQVAGIVLLVLSTGMSAKDLGGEVLNTIEVVRRGGEKETIIVPLRGEKPKPRNRDAGAAGGERVDLDRDIAAEEAALDAAEQGAPVVPAPPVAPTAAAPPPARGRPESSSIPLE